jgi:hypothetical protein
MEQFPAISIHLTFTEDELLELEKLSALGYTVAQMAMYFKRDFKSFEKAALDPESVISYHVARGELMSLANEQMHILLAAEGGNISASQQLANIKRNRGFKISKEEIFAGLDDMKTYRVFEDWVQGGCKSDISKEESIYLEALCKMNDMDRKYGRKNTVAFFNKKYNLSLSRASAMYDEAINLFNTDRNVTKKAQRHRYADQLDEMALMIKQNASGPKDAEVYGDLVMKAGKMRELDKSDPEPLPKELYLKPVRLMTLDPTMVGLSAINRGDVGKQIDDLDIPEADKVRVKADAMLTNINFEETLDELEEESRPK